MSSAGDESEGLMSDEDELLQYKALREKLKKKKAKKAKGELRGEVTEARKLKPTIPYAAKVEDDERAKKESMGIATQKKGLEGFRKDWNKLSPPTATPASNSQHNAPARQSRASRQVGGDTQLDVEVSAPVPTGKLTAPRLITKQETPADDESEQEAGFKDESATAVSAARSSKAARLTQQGGTATMGLKVKKVPISDEIKESAVPKKKNYSNKDLPLTGVTNGVQRWQRQVMPTVFAWAGTVANVFDVNSHPKFPSVVADAWDEEFAGEADFKDVVVQVAGAAVRTWRSKMGKEALDALRDHFDNQKFRKAEVRAKFVRDQLDNCRYLYEDPEKETGVYRAPLLLQVYGYHEGLIEGRTDAWYGNPVGALAFAATALERALKLWKGGSEVASSDRKNFVRKPWGERVDFHLETIQTLKDGHWKKIDAAAMPYVKAAQDSGAALGDGDEEDEDTGRKVVIRVSSDEE